MNLTAYSCLVVRSVCVTVDTPLTHLFLLGEVLSPYSTLIVSVRLSSRNSRGHISQLSKALTLERNRMHVCTTHTSSRAGHRCLALRAGDGGLKDLCMAPQLSQCHKLLCKVHHLQNCIDNDLPQALWGNAILLFYKAQLMTRTLRTTRHPYAVRLVHPSQTLTIFPPIPNTHTHTHTM